MIWSRFGATTSHRDMTMSLGRASRASDPDTARDRMHILTGVRELGLAVLETAVRRRPDLEGRIRAYV